MTVVNFYILPDSDLQQRLLFVVKLVKKSFEQQLKTLVVAADQIQLTTLDALIWTTDNTSFIPHEILTHETDSPLPTVLLTEQLAHINSSHFVPDVVIDLSYDAAPLDFPKVMLVANQHVDVLSNARMKYQSYVNIGKTPNIYKLGTAE